jgi:hypothetical protein
MSSPLAMALAEANRSAPAPAQPTVAPTNVAGIYANNDAQKMAEYQAQLAQQNAQFGGLASLGSALIGAGGTYLGGRNPTLSPGTTGPGSSGSSYTIGYGGQNVPVF